MTFFSFYKHFLHPSFYEMFASMSTFSTSSQFFFFSPENYRGTGNMMIFLSCNVIYGMKQKDKKSHCSVRKRWRPSPWSPGHNATSSGIRFPLTTINSAHKHTRGPRLREVVYTCGSFAHTGGIDIITVSVPQHLKEKRSPTQVVIFKMKSRRRI